MIYLSGAINLRTVEEMQREADIYQQNGWTLRDPTTHRVTVSIDEKDIEAFCDYLRNKPRDERLKTWTDRNGQQRQSRTISFYLNGTEMTGNWVRLRSRLDSTVQSNQNSRPAPAPAAAPNQPGRASAAAPQRQPAPAPTRAPASSPAAVWTAPPPSPLHDDHDIPF